jgi:parallel beta-helix repeat protein
MLYRPLSRRGAFRSGFRVRDRRVRPSVEVCEARRLLALAVSDASVLEDPNGTAFMQFTVTIDQNPQTPVTVFYYTTDGSPDNPCVPAVNGVDYQGVPQSSPASVVFPINTTQQIVTIPVTGSYRIKPTECFTLNAFRIGSGTSGIPETAFAMGSILNNNGLVVTNTNNTGFGSLFGTIQSVNQSNLPGVPKITFAISKSSGPGPTFTITPPAPLPAVNRPADIDATTQPGYKGSPLVVLSGAAINGPGSGLTLRADRSEVHGLEIDGWQTDGVVIDPLVGGPSGSAVVSFNTINNAGRAGVHVVSGNQNQVSDNTIVAPGTSGLLVDASGGSSNNTVARNVVRKAGGAALDLGVGSSDAVTSNTLTDSAGPGIVVRQGGTGNTIAANTVVNAGATAIALGGGLVNTVSGNVIQNPKGAGVTTAIGASEVTVVGNLVADAGDSGIVIATGSNNTVHNNSVMNPRRFGVVIASGSTGDVVSGNSVVNAGQGGLQITSAQNAAVSGNVVVNPATGGILISGLSGGTLVNNVVQVTTPAAKASGVSAILLKAGSGNSLTGNVVLGSGLAGIELSGGSGNSLTGNTVIDASGSGVQIVGSAGNVLRTNMLGLPGHGNAQDGLTVLGASSGNLIGGAGSGNIMCSNGRLGIRLGDGSSPGPTGNVVQGNTVGAGAGVAPAGTGVNTLAGTPGRTGRGNVNGGIFLDNASGNLVGGSNHASANLVADNGGPGIQVTLGSANRIEGNTVGLDPTGTLASGNALDGIYLDSTRNNLVLGNVISGNGLVGLRVSGPVDTSGSVPSSTGNVVMNNTIGTNAAGTAAVGNAFDGVFLLLASRSNTFLGNLIAGNGAVGVQLMGPGVQGNTFALNKIGIDVTGTSPLPNALGGVFINNAPGNVIGLPGAGNIIVSPPASGSGRSAVGGTGVQIFNRGAAGNVVQSNVINDNASGQPFFADVVGVYLNHAGANTVTLRGANANVIGGPVNRQVVTVTGPGPVIAAAAVPQPQITRRRASRAR